MKQTVVPSKTPTQWSADALYMKSERYIQNMNEFNSDDWEYGLWSSLSLELLARAALSNISPALLADSDGKNSSSLQHALGFQPTEEKFLPKSIAISEVFKRLTSLLPNFTKEHESFGIQHTGMRNSELHSGEPAFEGVKGSSWQPRYFRTCEILLESMGLTLEKYVGKDEAKAAQKMIVAAADESAKAVKGDLEAHKKVWSAKSTKERKTLGDQALVWASRSSGHRVSCPACESQALVIGEAVSAPTQRLVDGDIVETQEYLPNLFQCVACGLKVSGLSRLAVIGLGDRYKKTLRYDAAEYYAPQDEYLGYEDDNNER